MKLTLIKTSEKLYANLSLDHAMMVHRCNIHGPLHHACAKWELLHAHPPKHFSIDTKICMDMTLTLIKAHPKLHGHLYSMMVHKCEFYVYVDEGRMKPLTLMSTLHM